MCTPAFLQLIKKLFILIRHGDNESTGPIKSENIEKFIRLLSGWKTAQTIIAEEIVIRLRQVKDLERKKKIAHSKKDYVTKQACIKDVVRTQREITILRRCIDSLVWTMLGNEHSSIRRLPINSSPDNLSEHNILDSKSAADSINTDPLAFAVITDMTTFVHTGDLLALIPGHKVSLIELKSGKKNIEFSDAAEFAVLSGCPHFDEAYTKDFDKKDLNHYQRAKRQIVRAKNVVDAIENGSGFDNYHQTNVKIQDRNFIPDFFSDRIIELWYKVYNGKNWAIDEINECLYIGAYKRSDMGFVGFNTWMDGCNISATVYNILDSFADPLARPFFSLNLPDKLILDIINNDLILVMCFDHKLFTKRANEKYPELYFLSPFPSIMKHTEEMMCVDGKGIGSYVDNQISYLGKGYEVRVIFDLQYPDSLIDWGYKMSDLKKKSVKEKNKLKRKSIKKIKDKRRNSRK
jgi:hypothetical protein